jgi:acyl-CoA dehydrogenase
MQILLMWILLVGTTGTVAYFRLPLWIWTVATALILAAASLTAFVSPILLSILWVFFALIAFFNITPLRRMLISRPVFSLYKKIMPAMSSTEKEALDAGVVTWEADLFSGHPDWKKLLKFPAATLTAEEQAFLDNETNELCSQIDEWKMTHIQGTLPDSMWQYLKDKGFFSFIIPKSYGGLEFSPYAVSRILIKLYSCSTSLAATVGVPNSLGPAELLLKYGTQTQKDYYLPRLAKGLEIPCFALTSPVAGSDAAAIPDIGIVCKGMFEGKEILGINLNFDKRYITLAPIASLIGLAFHLRDPDHLIGTVNDYGITCALIPRHTPNIKIGRRHFPVNQVFLNGPVRGKDVFVPLDYIIGGQQMAGKGWKMLMECLAEGRAVTLPSGGVAGTLFAAHTSGAYARIRKQFGLPIGRFEGIEEVLAAIGGNAYLCDAALRMTLAYMNQKQKSAVAAAIVKYHLTEKGRETVRYAMDIHAGKGICMGPNNYLARGFQAQPVAITVEGANILTRSMIIFGQGAVRCHPYVFQEMTAVANNDLKLFDKVFWKHIGHVHSNFFRTMVMSLTNSHFINAPEEDESRRYYKILTRYSAMLALFSDMAMFTLGGSLKRREKISGRLGDILSYLYIASAVLKRFHDEGSQEEDVPLLHWSMRTLIYNMQEVFHNLLRNFPNRIIARLLRGVMFPWGRLYSNPLDSYGKNIANILLCSGEARDRLLKGLYIPDTIEHNFGLLNITLKKVEATDKLEHQVMLAHKQGKITGDHFMDKIDNALKAGIITEWEATELREMETLRQQVIAVDDFDSKELFPQGPDFSH